MRKKRNFDEMMEMLLRFPVKEQQIKLSAIDDWRKVRRGISPCCGAWLIPFPHSGKSRKCLACGRIYRHE